MRIACIHIPQFALQCATRVDPALRPDSSASAVEGGTGTGTALVVVGTSHTGSATSNPLLHAPLVLACSRAAWSLGVRVGMTATTARSLSPALTFVTTDPHLERDTIRAIADILLGTTPVVEVGGRVGPGGAHLALYCEVPAKTRGTTFGERLLERLAALGITARIGIADDRFTAWVAAWLGPHDAPSTSSTTTNRRHDDSAVVSVPRGGSAAFLAPRPLALLSISPEVQHMLEALGVRTLGEFAALPAPTVSSRFEADYQALARGESGNLLRPYTPDAPIREEVVVHSHTHDSDKLTDKLSTPAAIALLAERIAMRLAGRARCAARLEVTVANKDGEHLIPFAPVRTSGVISSAEDLAEAIGTAIGDKLTHAWRLRVVVTGEALAGDAPETVFDTPTQRTFATVSPASASATPTLSVTVTSPTPEAAKSSNTSAPPETFAEIKTVDPLSVVLASTGSSLDRAFGLTSPVARDTHRRTRRGKQRRRMTTDQAVQPRLFKL